MNIQFEHIYLSSFLLYLDHYILSQGNSFQNYSGQFYPINSNIQGQTAYSCGFRQIVNDTSISGANVMTGIYLNGNFVTPGTSGLYSINHYFGNIYFTGTPPPANSIISAGFAIKDFNVQIVDESEYDILFNTKFQTNPLYNQVINGLDPNVLVEPAVLVRLQESEFKPFAFDRIDDNRMRLRLIVITDNEFQRAGIAGIIKNMRLTTFPLISQTPMDYFGNYFGGNPYNYNTITPYAGNTYQSWVWDARVIQIPKRPFIEPTKFIVRKVCFVDIDLSTIVQH